MIDKWISDIVESLLGDCGSPSKDKKDIKQFIAKQYLKDLHPRFDFLFYANDLNENRFCEYLQGIAFQVLLTYKSLGDYCCFHISMVTSYLVGAYLDTSI